MHYNSSKSLLTRDDRELHLQGSCASHIAMLLQLSDVLPPVMRFCVPERSTVREATEAVTSYMDRHASDLHLAFSVVAVLALREAWPCRTSGETAAHEDTRGRLLHAQPLAGGELFTPLLTPSLGLRWQRPFILRCLPQIRGLGLPTNGGSYEICYDMGSEPHELSQEGC